MLANMYLIAVSIASPSYKSSAPVVALDPPAVPVSPAVSYGPVAKEAYSLPRPATPASNIEVVAPVLANQNTTSNSIVTQPATPTSTITITATQSKQYSTANPLGTEVINPVLTSGMVPNSISALALFAIAVSTL